MIEMMPLDLKIKNSKITFGGDHLLGKLRLDWKISTSKVIE